jgi:hypothetical protein
MSERIHEQMENVMSDHGKQVREENREDKIIGTACSESFRRSFQRAFKAS